MSETPTLPISDKKNDQVVYRADQIMHDPLRNAEFFERAETQVSIEQPPRFERWDLDEPVQPFNPDRAPANVSNEVYAVPPEHAERPLTRAQELEMSLFAMTKEQLLHTAATTTQSGVIGMRHHTLHSN